QGTKTGERALLQLQRGKNKIEKFADLEMRDKLAETLRAQLAAQSGLIVVSAPPAGGLSTLFTVTVSAMDRFVRSFVGLESSVNSEFKVENVPVTYFNPAASENPLSILPKLVREHPDVFIVPDMVDADSAAALLEQVEHENRQVVTSVRAKEAADSLLRLLDLGMPPEKLAAGLTVALNQRMIRKLCNKCKEAYAPAPNVLEQLGIPAGRVEAFYRVPQPKPEDEKDDEGPCKKCQGIGYFGRTALYELLIVDDGVRAALTRTPQLAALRAAARKAGMRTLQEEGIVLVAKGVTSLPELMRVLKE
ncbi:MAG TPA: ATPase, T2SS/T4P/T4SS family, partial [Pirellulales bacterium]